MARAAGIAGKHTAFCGRLPWPPHVTFKARLHAPTKAFKILRCEVAALMKGGMGAAEAAHALDPPCATVQRVWLIYHCHNGLFAVAGLAFEARIVNALFTTDDTTVQMIIHWLRVYRMPPAPSLARRAKARTETKAQPLSRAFRCKS
jgi:hypothetical protein